MEKHNKHINKHFILLLIIYISCVPIYLQSQIITPVLLAPLPDSITESSGIEVNNSNSIWTHNDSGDKARIYKIDTLGNLLRILNFKNTNAIDCEDITQDNLGNYYLGDFGNNNNDRTNLRIYKIPNPDLIVGDSVLPQVIHFHYPDQDSFPPALVNQNFDCEAMFHFNGNLYLFSKNRGVSKYSRMYRLPDTAGTYTATLVDSISTEAWVTSADISPSGKTVAILSDMNLWLITGFNGTDFLHGNVKRIDFTYTQKEGVVFVNDTTLYLTDEKALGIGGNLYKLSIESWLNSVSEIKVIPKAKMYPNPITENSIVEISDLSKGNYTIIIYDNLGSKLLERKITQSTNSINLHNFKKGIYFYSLIDSKGNITNGKLLK